MVHNPKAERRRLAFAYVILGLVALSMILPFAWMVSTSLKEKREITDFPPKFIPQRVTFTNYVGAFRRVPFDMFFFNSIVVALCVTFGQVLTSSLAAYAFARLEFPGRDWVFAVYIATMMVPGQVTLIPNFALITKLGWIDTYKALIVPCMFSAYGTFMLRQFFLGIPKELEEAAAIDGCSRFGMYWRIILPLAKPALATLSIFTFLGSWNAFLWPLLVTQSLEMRTLPVGLAAFQGKYSTDWGLLMAGSLIVLAPVLILYIFNQRFFVKGMAQSGIKG